MMHLIISWRNIWRNPRRTLVILMAVIIGVWSMIFLGALMRGMETEMVKNSIAALTGSIQIHHKDYINDPAIENSMKNIDQLNRAMDTVLGKKTLWAKRIRVSAVASNARHSDGVILVGIEPGKEAGVSFIGKAVTSGRYLDPNDKNKIIVGRAFLEKFDTKINNKLILMSQNINGEIASRAFKIVGVFKASSQAIEKQFVFVNLSEAADMLKMEHSISELSILLPELDIKGKQEHLIADKLRACLSITDPVILDSTKTNLANPDIIKPDSTSPQSPSSQPPVPNLVVETWQQRLPMINAYLEISDFFLYIWYIVVFIAMGFGIVNTTLMAIFERMREFGLMKALGMGPFQIIQGVITETFFLLVLGISTGMVLGFGTIAVIAQKGIDLSALAAGVEMWGIPRTLYPEIWFRDAAAAGGVVLVLGIFVSLYPAVKAARFTPVQAMMKH